ncbi:CLUMA_CG016463, isoform A, partial [Clunio marinus]
HLEEPLLESSSLPPAYEEIAKNNRWRINKKAKFSGLNLRRRDPKAYQEKCGRIRLLAVLCAFAFLLIYLTNLKPYQNMIVVRIPEDDQDIPGPKENQNTSANNPMKSVPGYLVWSPQCKMPSLEPLAPDVMKLFSKEVFEPCSKKHPLTSIEQNFDDDTVKVILHHGLKSKYLSSDQNQLECCYKEITRGGSNATADDKFNLSKCQYFDQSFDLPTGIEFILIQCKGSNSKDKKKVKTVYSNAHAIVRRKPQMQKTFDSFKTLYPDQRPLSVLMMGIDSISRLNLIRSMPFTAQHLYDRGWFELKGYNKMDDNTFPNLMAILTGFNRTYAYHACDPKQIGHLDNCPFIWKHFQNSGYVTGYAEDEAKIGTFNYHKLGFLNQPTNHYFRPFSLAAEKYLKIKLKSSLKFCLGFQNYADFIYQYALDFATAYKDDPFFGLFWSNTFSHNDISDPSSMDERIKSYLEELDNRGVLNTSAVVFFSDHGIRFGPVRQLLTGWFEERLPFIFIWLPEWFKTKHPEIVRSLKINRNRLTNPYDLHMTLKHTLELSGRIDNLPPSESCPDCQSIFNVTPWNRSCSDAGIEAHWCACTTYTSINKQDEIVKKAVKFVIDSINEDLDKNARVSNSTKPLCAHMYLKSIKTAKKSEVRNDNKNNEYTDYLLTFDVSPSNAKFESTVRSYHNAKTSFEITGSISRLNEYSSQSYCVNIDYLKKYCFCIKRKKS